ncbi:MAG: hypothetical protein FJ108_17225 [Deltaproteobacteria bacterium]|nr:hypothetical protein [Deltaproteobacteria bacterium]
MKRRIVATLLIVATIAIGIENWLFFSSGWGGTPVAASDDESASDGSGPAGQDPSEAQLPPPPALAVSALASLLESFDALRSPFLPTREGSREGLGIPALAGLLIGDGRRVAWLGSHARSEGELYDGFVVARIEPARVVLERDGRRFSLWLDESERDGSEEEMPR